MATSAAGGARLPGSPAERFAALWAAEGGHGEEGPEPGWRVKAPPDFEAFLADCPGATAADRLAVMLVDQAERWRRDRGLPAEAYLAAAADVAADPSMLDALALGELWARRGRGESIDLDDFARRFPHLRDELSALLSRADIAMLAETRDGFPRAGETRYRCETDAADPGATAGPAGAWSPGGALGVTRGDFEDGSLGFALDAGVAAPEPDAGAAPAPTHPVRFSVIRRVGAGGMGVVYQALDRKRGEMVALKTMRRTDPVTLLRFKQEFRALADLSHPNLANLYELFAVGEIWFFTMELVEGEDFVRHVLGPPEPSGPVGEGEGDPVGAAPHPRDRPGGAGPDRVSRLRRAGRQLAEGVQALHESGKLHRDVKPTNVLVTPEGRVVLLDFGLTADLERSGYSETRDERVVGTVGYMSPEQAAGRPLSVASDWYSVGVVLYESLTGRLPFEGSPGEVLAAKHRGDPPPPSSLTGGVPDDLNDLCAGLLRRDPGARPAGPAVVACLAADPGSAAAPGPVLPPSPAAGRPAAALLVGRERHREALDAALGAVKAGRPVLMFVSGRSGSGKSTLLQAFLGDLSASGEAVVLSGRCYERESVPYKALDGLVDSLSHYLKATPADEVEAILPRDMGLLARMFPVLGGVEVGAARRAGPAAPDHQESKRRGCAALRELLGAIGRRGPLVAAIDDLQWGDAENAALIRDLLRPPDPPVMLLLGSYRTEDADRSPLLRALLDPPAGGEAPGAGAEGGPERRELTVGPLSAAESRELALALLGRRDALARAEAHVVARESRGNPFFIDELVKHIQEGEALAGRGVAPGQVAPGEVLWGRVTRLPEGARRLLEVVAVSGRPVDLADACEAAGVGPGGRAAVSALRAGRLVRATGRSDREEVEAYHDWVRETVVGHLGPEVLAEHHLRLAGVLGASGRADAETLAVHYEMAGRPVEAAGHYARAAERAGETLAFLHASRLYRRALGLRPGGAGDAEGVALRTRLADALANAGRGREAAGEYLGAADSAAGPALGLELKRRAAMQLLISGHVDEGLGVLGTVLRARGLAMPATPVGAWLALARRRAWLRLRGMRFRPRAAAEVSAEALSLIDLCWSAGAGLSLIDPVRGADFQTRGLLLALAAGEPYRVARSLALEAATVSLSGAPAVGRARGLMGRVVGLSCLFDSPHVDGLVALARALAALMLGRWKEAYQGVGLAEPLLRGRCTGVAWELDTLNNMTLWALTQMGDLPELRRRWPEMMRDARSRGDLYAVTTLSTYYRTLLLLADGEPGAALAEVGAVMSAWSRRGYHVQHSLALRAAVAVALYRGDPESAWERVAAEWPSYRRSLLTRVQVIRVQMTEVRARCALAAAGRTAAPGRLVAEVERGARALEKERVPWAGAHAAVLRAGLTARRGDAVGAAAGLLAAAARFEAEDMRLLAASARLRAAGVLGPDRGRTERAAAEAALTALGVRDPDALASVFVPRSLPGEDQSKTLYPA